MNFVTSISLVVLGAIFLALLGWGSIRAAWRNCEGRRGVFAALAILAAVCSIVAQKPSPVTPTITVDALLRDVGCYATNDVFHAAVTNAPSYAGVDFSDCDLMVYARERASTDAASWFELTPRKKFSQQPADYAIENATNFNYMIYLNYVPPSPVHTNGVFELYGFVIENEAQGEPDQLAAGFINSRAIPPPYDAEVEYLESTGTQWIDTGLDYFADFEITAKLRTSVPNVTLYAGDGNRFERNNSTYPNWRFRSNAGGTYNSTVPITELHTLAWRNGKVYSDGVEIATHTKNFPSNRMYVFGFPTAQYPAMVYALKLYDANGVLVRDYIPVRVGTTGELFDRVSGTFATRHGTFNYGNDK